MRLITFGSNILFVCTGKLFRSLTAEYALKVTLGEGSDLTVKSAELLTPRREVPPLVTRFFEDRGVDLSAHLPRKLTHAMLAEADFAVAMGMEDRDLVARIFGYQLPFFSEIAYQRTELMPVAREGVPNWHTDPVATLTYAQAVMRHIFEGMPGFVARMKG